jgi:hypothetical protein
MRYKNSLRRIPFDQIDGAGDAMNQANEQSLVISHPFLGRTIAGIKRGHHWERWFAGREGRLKCLWIKVLPENSRVRRYFRNDDHDGV